MQKKFCSLRQFALGKFQTTWNIHSCSEEKWQGVGEGRSAAIMKDKKTASAKKRQQKKAAKAAAKAVKIKAIEETISHIPVEVKSVEINGLKTTRDEVVEEILKVWAYLSQTALENRKSISNQIRIFN